MKIKMKNRIISFILVAVTLLNLMPLGILTSIAQEKEGLDVSELELGVPYSAVFDYSRSHDTYIYKLDEGGKIRYESALKKADLPQELVVRLVEEGDRYVYVSGSIWPSEYEDYRFIDADELIILEKYVPEKKDDSYAYGQIRIDCDGAVGGTVFLKSGDRKYAYAKTGYLVGDNAQYRWQIKIGEDRWATISSYVYPYAVISETLLVNAPDGIAVIRCIARDGEVEYISETLTVQRAPADTAMSLRQSAVIPLEAKEYLSDGASGTDTQPDETGGGTAADGFQIIINYVYRHANPAGGLEWINGAPAANVFSITLPKGGHYKGTVVSPPVQGYSPYVRYTLQEGDVVDGVNIREYPEDSNEYYKAISYKVHSYPMGKARCANHTNVHWSMAPHTVG